MKKLLLIIACIFLHCIISVAQPGANTLLPEVDERIELLCIAGRLANIEGFNDTQNLSYTKAIEQHFNKFSNHPLINFFRAIKPQLDTAYWQILALAVHLSQPPELKPLISYTDTAYVDMWEDRTLFTQQIVALVQQFYKDTNCDSFFKSQHEYYKKINDRYKNAGIYIHKDWLKQFFGFKTTERYYAIIAPGMKDDAYMRVNFPNNLRNTYTIFGCTAFDINGTPENINNAAYTGSMLHEYIHAFTNQLIDKHSIELQKPAETILQKPEVWKLMRKTFYGNWQYLLYESMVRACTIKYLMANEKDKSVAADEMTKQEKLGFFWMKDLVKQLDMYEQNRNIYHNLEMFMPEIITFFKNTAEENKK